jgi:hypothetical protein
MKALGPGRLRTLGPKAPGYQWDESGDMIHGETKQLARLERVKHRITGDRRQGSSGGAGYEKDHVAVDDATRLADLGGTARWAGSQDGLHSDKGCGWLNKQGITCRRIFSEFGFAYGRGSRHKDCGA